ncbi:MAG: hypothetical protein R3A80_09820 [Bdellovibrionota bacterium]
MMKIRALTIYTLFPLLGFQSAHALAPELACAILLKRAKVNYAWRTGRDMGAHVEIIGALQKFLRDETLTQTDKEMLELHNLTDLMEYWKTQPKLKQKMRYWLELFIVNQTKDFKENKAAYQQAIAELNLMDRTGMLASLFIARHPFFVFYLTVIFGPFAANALYDEPVSSEEADEILKTPVPDDEIEYVFYPKHVGMRVRDQFFDVGPNRLTKLESAPERPRLDGVTLIRIKGDSGLADRVLERVKNYPVDKKGVYNTYNSSCLANANDLIRDETGLCIPPGIATQPSATEGWLKLREFFGSAKITQIKTLAPDKKYRQTAYNPPPERTRFYKNTKYLPETTVLFGELAILDLLHDSAEVNFPKQKQQE